MNDSFSEEIKIRVPKHMKLAFAKLAHKKTKKESELAREAFVDYLARPEFQAILREASPPEVNSSNAETIGAEESVGAGEMGPLINAPRDKAKRSSPSPLPTRGPAAKGGGSRKSSLSKESSADGTRKPRRQKPLPGTPFAPGEEPHSK